MKVFSGKRRESRGRSHGADSGAGAARDDPRSFRWRANFVLALLVCGSLGLVWRAVELQLKDHKFLAGQGDARFSRVAEITATRGSWNRCAAGAAAPSPGSAACRRTPGPRSRDHG